MKRFLAGLMSFGLITSGSLVWAETLTINGAGATFPYPIYSKWFDEYHKANPEIEFNYQAIGSGGGIKQLTAQTVDFGASDGPMSSQQLEEAPFRILHFPTVLGGVVPSYNIPGVTAKLNFSQKAIAGIYLGSITKWNDPEIQSHNADVKLPDAAIVVVHRSDGSGTTYCWSDFLSKISTAWKMKVGMGTSVNWPVGLGGKGNQGVAGLVTQTPNSIGYVELIYAKQNNIPYGTLQNKAGKFVECSLASVTAAAAGAAANMPSDFRVSITNAPGDDAYPASTFTWLLIRQNMSKIHTKGEVIVKFIRWMLTEGQKDTEALVYAPLPASVVSKEEAAISKIKY